MIPAEKVVNGQSQLNHQLCIMTKKSFALSFAKFSYLEQSIR